MTKKDSSIFELAVIVKHTPLEQFFMDKFFFINIGLFSPIFYLFIRLAQGQEHEKHFPQWFMNIFGDKIGKELAHFISGLWGAIVIMGLIWLTYFYTGYD